jgi:hypothetical protein
MVKILAIFVAVILPAGFAQNGGYVGSYKVRNMEIHYFIPEEFVGLPVFTHIDPEFHEGQDGNIFQTSFATDLNGKPAPGLSLGLAPAPGGVPWSEDISPYTKYYEQMVAKMGLTCKGDAESLGGRRWLRIQLSFKNGNLVRVFYVTKLFDDMILVCGLGVPSALDSDYRPPHASQWSEQIEAIVRQLTIVQLGKD